MQRRMHDAADVPDHLRDVGPVVVAGDDASTRHEMIINVTVVQTNDAVLTIAIDEVDEMAAIINQAAAIDKKEEDRLERWHDYGPARPPTCRPNIKAALPPRRSRT